MKTGRSKRTAVAGLIGFAVLTSFVWTTIRISKKDSSRMEIYRRTDDPDPGTVRIFPNGGLNGNDALLRTSDAPVFPDAACCGLIRDDFRLYRDLVAHFETKGALAPSS
ncbi:MAG: hypothetical protein IJ678_00405 [Kiritimatiellae bacterium]|nr:hypothetical protein [Kiritimatiellia bacterium]